MDKKRILEISNSLKFNINDEAAQEILDSFNEFEKEFNKLKEINTNNIKPMTRIDDSYISFLREDKIKNELSKEDFLKNAPNKDKDYIILNKEELND